MNFNCIEKRAKKEDVYFGKENLPRFCYDEFKRNYKLFEDILKPLFNAI